MTLRQFIFGLIAAFCGYISFIAIAKHVPVLLAFFLPPGLFCAFFAFPWGRDQPTETWALAKLRFLFKPRRRVWNQSGIKELVTITAPKKIEKVLTDNLSQTEVKSRLQALAETIDSRGWAIKHINNVGYVPSPLNADPDRLINIPDVPPQDGSDGMAPGEDVMDSTNPVARQFQSMIDQSTREYRNKLVAQLETAPPSAAAPAPQWFSSQDLGAGPARTPAPAPTASAGPTNASDADLSAALKRQASKPDESTANMRTLQPLGTAPPAGPPTAPAKAQNPAPAPMTDGGDPAILSLSKNNDLNVATIAREAQRAKEQDEVVISLH